MNSAPILIFGFNRPDRLARVFAALESRPKETIFYVILDHPRRLNAKDERLCGEVLQAAEQFCRNFPNAELVRRSVNFGCRRNIEEGIDFVLSRHDRVIILEDDCQPSSAFISFCDALLIRYKDDHSVGMICGGNFLNEKTRPPGLYRTRYPLIWGWATWQRVWKIHDKKMASFGNIGLFVRLFGEIPLKELLYWRHYFIETKEGRIDTWDYQLTWTFFANRLSALCPTRNQVTNIGFGLDATHTFHDNREQSVPISLLELGHEKLTEISMPEADEVVFARRFGGFSWGNLFRLEVKRMISFFK